MRFAAHIVLAAALVAPLPSGLAPAATRPVHERYDTPVQVTNAGDGTDRLFVVERRGVIRATRAGGVSTTFLDIRSIVQDGGERGLLGLAFHPRFRTNRHLFVFYTRDGGDIVVARYTANATRSRVDPATARGVLLIEHSERSNHNGGGLAFGPDDGYLYVAIGDGGGAGDPEGDAQVDHPQLPGQDPAHRRRRTGSGTFGRYAIPPATRSRARPRAADEIWALRAAQSVAHQLRPRAGALYIGDVGQGSREEIDREPARRPAVANYGWNVMEGSTATDPPPVRSPATPCRSPSTRTPGATARSPGATSIAARPSRPWSGITSSATTAPAGSGRSGRVATGADITLRRDTPYQITSFGEHEDGELYFVTIDGRLERFRLG